MMVEIARRVARLRVVAVLGLLAFGTPSAASADILVAVETPQNQTAAPQPFLLKGWALDTAAIANPGIAEVQVVAFPNPGSGEAGILFGTATYGGSRPHVGQQRGAQFTNSGYELLVRGLAPKTYLFAAYARSSISNIWGVIPGTVTLHVQATPIMYTSTPTHMTHVAQPFTLGGFAIDFASVSGSGVSQVWVVAFSTKSDTVVPVGEAVYGISVPSVGAYFGDARFAASGFAREVTGLPPGEYDLVSFAKSTVSGTFNSAHYVRVEVDTPAPSPVISLPSGTYAPPQSVTIIIPSETQVFITRDGTTPTQMSEPYVGDVLTVSMNTSLRARAFRAGWAPSPVAEADYTMVGSAPTILTAGGQFEAPVSVEISAPSGTTVRITRDGSTPTTASEEYGAPFEIAQDTQLRAVGFSTGMAPSPTAAANYSFVTAVPTFSMPGGTYTGSLSVALMSATPGASLYWTVDGSEPSTSSNAYTTPITIATGNTTTLKARAVRAGWPVSTVATATYDTTGLTGPVTISARVSPVPNSAGWNNSDVTVAFVCTNASVCPSPVVVTQETAGQTVSGTASNSDHESTASVVVRIDRTPPVLASVSPADGSTTDSATASVSANVVDALSGLSTARCNSAETTANPSLQCVIPLSFGRNTVTLSAQDAAGNSGSVGIRILRTGTRSRLLITPSHRTVTIGQRLSLFASDEYGQVVSTVAWTSSDVSVGTVTSDTGRFTALAPGQTTVTASEAGLSATMTVTVVATAFGDPLPAGTTEWTVAPSQPDSTVVKVLPARRVGNESPDLFVLEHAANGSNVIRGLTADGTQLWTEAVPVDLSMSPSAFADAFGGVVAMVRFGTVGSPAGLVRVAGPSSAPPWRYESTALLVGNAAQAPDGTIYLFEMTFQGSNYVSAAIVAIDGSNGRARFRVALPSGVGGDPIQSTGPGAGRIAIDADGKAYVQVSHTNEFLTPQRLQGDEQLQLLTLQSDGTATWRLLDQATWDVPRSEGRGGIFAGPVIADGMGGVLLSWMTSHTDALSAAPVVRLLDGQESRPVAAQGLDSSFLVMSGEDGTVLRLHTTTDFVERVIALDPVSGATKWIIPTRGHPLAVLPGGAALVYDSGSLTLSHIDSSGQIVGTQMLGLLDPLQTHDDAFVGATANGTIAKITTASFADRTFAPSQSGQGGVNLPSIHTFAPENDYHSTPNPFLPTDLVSRINEAISPENATAYTRIVSQARVDPFISTIGAIFDSPAYTSLMKQHVTVAGVIAHSVDIREPLPGGDIRNFSVGVQLFDQDLIKKRPGEGATQWVNLKRCQTNPPNLSIESPECLEYARPFARWIDKIYTHAKVIVLATCFVGEELLSLFDITGAPGEDKVLIVPENPNLQANLVYAARFGWPTIANELSLGHTVGQAIAKANECIPMDDKGTPNPLDDTWVPDATFRGPCSPNRIMWKRVGGTDAMRIRPVVR